MGAKGVRSGAIIAAKAKTSQNKEELHPPGWVAFLKGYAQGTTCAVDLLCSRRHSANRLTRLGKGKPSKSLVEYYTSFPTDEAEKQARWGDFALRQFPNEGVDTIPVVPRTANIHKEVRTRLFASRGDWAARQIRRPEQKSSTLVRKRSLIEPHGQLRH